MAYVEGRRAYNQGKPLSANPYKDGTMDYLEWRIGWRTARTVDQEQRVAA